MYVKFQTLLMHPYLNTSVSLADDVEVGVVCIQSVHRGGAVDMYSRFGSIVIIILLVYVKLIISHLLLA